MPLITSAPRAEWTASCIAGHTGVWAMEPARLRVLAGLAFAGKLPARMDSRERGDENKPEKKAESPAEREARLVSEIYSVDERGIGVVTIDGVMQKYDSKWGGTVNTTRVRRIARSAMASDRVRGVMFVVDSPGGSADGTLELADDIAALARVKPTATYVTGMMASAAVWAFAQTGRATSGPADLTGSIGTYAVVEDWSKWYEDKKIGIEVIAAGGEQEGGVKGAGVSGVPVTDAYRAEIRKIVNGLNDLFIAGVADGRRMTPQAARALADGRVHLGAQAVALGLLDGVESADAAMADLAARADSAGAAPAAASNGRKTRTARARLELDRAR